METRWQSSHQSVEADLRKVYSFLYCNLGEAAAANLMQVLRVYCSFFAQLLVESQVIEYAWKLR